MEKNDVKIGNLEIDVIFRVVVNIFLDRFDCIHSMNKYKKIE